MDNDFFSVLILDDEPIFVASIIYLCKKNEIKMNSHFCDDSLENDIRKNNVILILINLECGNNDSLSIIKNLRESFSSTQLRIIALYSDENAYLIHDFEETGANDVLQKTATYEIFINRIKKQLEQTTKYSNQLDAPFERPTKRILTCHSCLSIVSKNENFCSNCKETRPGPEWKTTKQDLGKSGKRLGNAITPQIVIVQFLKKGTYSELYRAQNIKTKKMYVVTYVKYQKTSSKRSDFQNVRNSILSVAGINVSGENILKVIDMFSINNNTSALLSPFLKGESLKTLIQRKEKLSFEKAIQIITGVIHGVLHAHNRGFIHQDLTPTSVYLHYEREHCIVKVRNFGLTIWKGSYLHSSAVFAHPEYASPEQLLKNIANKKSDIYGIGGILYFILTGKPPNSPYITLELLNKRHIQQPPSLSLEYGKKNKSIKFFDRIIARAMAPDPEERYENLEKMLNDIANFKEATKKRFSRF